MSVLRFKAGEIALVNVPGHRLHDEDAEIVVVGPWCRGEYITWNGQSKWCEHDADYLTVIAGAVGTMVDSQLRKKRPPEEAQVTKLKEDIKRWTSNKRPVSA